jgi:hypothetical protein
MTTATITTPADRLPVGATPVREGGLLSRVARDCPEHGGEAGCVARGEDERLVYWCARGEHYFSTPPR